ncbi:MAG: hypothetical protein AB1757_04460 [Acidobacteriota bacterium]
MENPNHDYTRNGAGRMTALELIQRCTLRPPDAVAWNEFVSRFHRTIHTSVITSLNLKAEAETHNKNTNAMVDDLVEHVYQRLIENRSQALRRLEDELAQAMDKEMVNRYLIALSIKVVNHQLNGNHHQS